MHSFSQRNGIEPVELPFQLRTITDRTRNRLWNILQVYVWEHWHKLTPFNAPDLDQRQGIHGLMNSICHNYFHWTLDTMPAFDRGALKQIRDIYFNYPWHKVFDFIEFVASNLDHSFGKPGSKMGLALADGINEVLKADNSAYRFVGLQATPISDEIELQAVQSVIQTPVDSVKEHIKTAILHLSNFEKPDYRNSIKESISAVEATCQAIVGNSSASLGDCLKVIKTKHPIHVAFESALGKLYGYTSDGNGIRHCLSDVATDLTADDAKFMLVTCSAFVNYLVSVAASTGLELKTPSS